MKYRLDFVTNSSSSSFIGVFARLDENNPKFEENKHKLAEYIKMGHEILEEMQREYFWGYDADWAGVYLTPDKEEVDKDATYVLWRSSGGAGDDDSHFWQEDGGYYDYDVCLSDFSYKEEVMYQYLVNESNGFMCIESGYGAGRDG